MIRDSLLDALFDAAPQPIVELDRHWFVPDAETGTYCRACNLPRANGRHVPRRTDA